MSETLIEDEFISCFPNEVDVAGDGCDTCMRSQVILLASEIAKPSPEVMSGEMRSRFPQPRENVVENSNGVVVVLEKMIFSFGVQTAELTRVSWYNIPCEQFGERGETFVTSQPRDEPSFWGVVVVPNRAVEERLIRWDRLPDEVKGGGSREDSIWSRSGCGEICDVFGSDNLIRTLGDCNLITHISQA